MQRSFLLSLIMLLVFNSFCIAQKRKKKKKSKDFIRIEVPDIHYRLLDTTTIFLFDNQYDTLPGLKKTMRSLPVDLRRKLSLVSEDTSEALAYYHIVEISEKIKVDCVWVTAYEYFGIWDSENVDPYKIESAKLKDTIALPLCDTVKGSFFSFPIKKDLKVTSKFGMRRYRWHYGVDLDIQMRDSIYAAFDGLVRISRYNRGGYGNYILIRHINGLETLYGHLSVALVQPGQEVKAGQLIALGGNSGRSTGSHLHFEIRYQGKAIDPAIMCDFDKGALKSDTLKITPAVFAYLREIKKVIYHKIRRGDTLSGISRRYGVSINTICRLNGIKRSAILRIGRRLRVR